MTTPPSQQPDRRALQLIAFVVVLALIAVAMRELRLRSMGHYFASRRYEDIYHLPPADWLPTMSLGHREAMASSLWMRALVYFGEEMIHRGTVKHVFDYGEAIVTLDPEFARAYSWIASAALYRPGVLTVPEAIRAAKFVERGAQRFPNDGTLQWDTGATIAYEIVPIMQLDPKIPRAEIDRVREWGARYLVRGVALGAGPPWAALSNAHQLERLGRTEQAVKHLEEVYALTRDSAMRARILERIQSYRSQAEAEAFGHAIEAFEGARRREYPYVDPDMYTFLHEPPASTSIDGAPRTDEAAAATPSPEPGTE